VKFLTRGTFDDDHAVSPKQFVCVEDDEVFVPGHSHDVEFVMYRPWADSFVYHIYILTDGAAALNYLARCDGLVADATGLSMFLTGRCIPVGDTVMSRTETILTDTTLD
jgi:hypothetical protein